MWTIEKYKEVYYRYESSGLPVEQFCLNERISRSRFYYWRRKYMKLPGEDVSISQTPGEANSHIKSTGFIPVWISSGNNAVENGSVGKVVSSPPRAEGGVYMELRYQNGTSVRLAGKETWSW